MMTSTIQSDTTTIAVVGSLVAILAGATVLLLDRRRRRDDDVATSTLSNKIPWVTSWIPFLGSGPAYFMNSVTFIDKMKKKHGDSFYFTVFGYRWLILCNREDIQSIVSMSENKCSMLKAYLALGGRLLPQNAKKGYYSSEEVAKRFDRENGAVPFFIHAMRPKRLRVWIPAVRRVLTDSFHQRLMQQQQARQGEIELFSWCQDLISAATVRVVMGNRMDQDPTLRDKWVKLFLEADPESALRSPAASLTSALEALLLGERRIYDKIRKFATPIVEEEIEKCIAGTSEYADDSASAGDNGGDASVLTSFVRSWWIDVKQDAGLLRQTSHRIVSDMFTFVFAAFSNSFGAAAWTLYHVLNNTAGVGDKVRAELNNVSADYDVAELVELEKTILEVCRLYTPGSILRKLMINWTMPSTGVEVKKGTIVAISSFFAMRNKDAFQNPKSFDPSRYDRGEASTAGCMFMPFGAGTHPCVGKRFAMLEIAIFCAEALRQFKLELLDTTAYDTNQYTKNAIDIENHPNLDPSQIAFIWRPCVPVKVRYELQ